MAAGQHHVRKALNRFARRPDPRSSTKVATLTPYRVAGAAIAAVLPCALLAPLPPRTTLDQRLAAFPRTELPLSALVVIHWNDHQVPFIEAESDDDLAFTLGLVHAHLRLGQMEVMRRISQGRIAEMGGPIATDIDHSLRILDVGRAAPEIVAAMPAADRRWLDSFVAGINFHLAHAATLPHEFAVLGLEREPWTAEDVVTIGRLGSVDVNWLVWFRLLKLRQRPDWPALWARLVEEGTASLPSYAAEDTGTLNALTDILGGMSRSGSNSLAVAASKSATGGALIASDPHLGISAPNLWLIAGYKSPSYHAVGMMIPGVPFIAVGRNADIAWGGTNMRSANSDLFDATSLDPASFSERHERIKVRWWFDRDITIRETPLGPIVSDAPMLPAGANDLLALHWIGHRPSDELSAMLAVNRARNWDEFRAALAGFAVSPQNMLYADAAGHIGMMMATHLPRRPLETPADLVKQPAEAAHWDEIVTGLELPSSFDPESGFLASANNLAASAHVPIGYFFSPNDRIGRLHQRLGALDRVSVDDLAALQRDVYMESAVRLRDAFLERLADLPDTAGAAALVRALKDWDGHYRVDARGPVAIELVTYYFVAAYYPEERRQAFGATGRLWAHVARDVREGEAAAIGTALATAVRSAAEAFPSFATWGDMHRLGLAHPLRFVPVLGGRYRFGDYPAAGGSATVMKTAHGLTDERHYSGYGSNARHISDMSDLDANHFVLLGGQDGWLHSSTFLDQYELWRRGNYIRVPLRLETVRAEYPHRMELTP